MMSSERGSDADHHEMIDLGQEQSRRSNIWPSGNCTSESEGFCIKALISLLTLTSLTFVVASGFFVGRFVHDGSFNSAVWSFFTGAVSCGIMSLFVLHLTQQIRIWHDKRTLNGVKIFSMVMSGASILHIITYVILGFVAKKKNEVTKEDYFISALICGFCLGCCFLLYFTSQWYQNNLPMELVNDEPVLPPRKFDEPQPGPSGVI